MSPQPAPHDTLSPNAQASKTSTASHAIRPPGPRKPFMQPAASRAAGQAGAVARRALAPILRLGRQVRADLPSTLRTQLGRVIRDIRRKIGEDAALRALFARSLSLAARVRDQRQRPRGPRGRKVYSLHAPEVECIGKVKPYRLYEFSVKV